MRLALTLIASAALLAACGGGSSSSDSDHQGGTPQPGPGNPAPSTQQAALTPANYVSVAQQALAANSFLLDSSGFAIGAEVSDPQATLVRVGEQQLAKLPQWFAKAPALATGAVHTETEPCEGGGSLILSINDRNGNLELDAGDSVTIQARNCVTDGVTINGRLGFTITRQTGDIESYPYTIAATVQYEELAVQAGASRIVGNGTLNVDVDARAYNQESRTLGTAQFSASATHGSSSVSQTLKNYTASLKTTPAERGSENWASSAEGLLFSSTLDSKSIGIATPAPFVRNSTQRYPATGQAIITGAAGAKVRVTAVDAASVKIELDANGDGTYETSDIRRWSELL